MLELSDVLFSSHLLAATSLATISHLSGALGAMGLGDLVQKAVYLGIGVASYAGEKATEKLAELRVQVQKLADEMVERGEMTTDEARRFVDDMVNKAQQAPAQPPPSPPKPSEPRKIEILTDEEETTGSATSTDAPPVNPVDAMRQQVLDLQEELKRLKQDNP